MSVLGTTSYTADNLVLGTDELVTDNVLALEAGVSCVRGEILKKGATGLVRLALVGDTPYCIALQTITGGASAQRLTYAIAGEFLASECSTNSIGTTATFKDGLRDVNIILR